MRKVLYFAPAIFELVFYSLLAVFNGFGAIHPAVWLCVAMLFVSWVLLAKKEMVWLHTRHSCWCYTDLDELPVHGSSA